MDAGVFVVLLDLVVVGGLHEVERGEGVAGGGDELTGFLVCKCLNELKGRLRLTMHMRQTDGRLA